MNCVHIWWWISFLEWRFFRYLIMTIFRYEINYWLACTRTEWPWLNLRNSIYMSSLFLLRYHLRLNVRIRSLYLRSWQHCTSLYFWIFFETIWNTFFNIDRHRHSFIIFRIIVTPTHEMNLSYTFSLLKMLFCKNLPSQFHT